MTTVPNHPAKFSENVLRAIWAMARDHDLLDAKRVLDPMAGVGRIYEVFPQATGIELLPRWAAADDRTLVGNILSIADCIGRRQFQLVVTSCTYGNRMADHHNAQDACKTCDGVGLVSVVGKNVPLVQLVCPVCKGAGLSKRNTYFHQHGVEGWVSDDNACEMQWGPDYRAFYEAAWCCVARRLDKPTAARRGGYFMLNISDHYRGGTRQYVEKWHTDTLKGLGLLHVARMRIKTPRQRQGANSSLRPATEGLHLFQRQT